MVENHRNGWDAGTEIPTGELIQNSNKQYNDAVAAKNWNKIDPKDAEIIALTTRLSNLERKHLYL